MIKKQLANGEPCQKCAQAEDLLRRRGLWDRIDAVVVALEADASSPGMVLAREHDVTLAPFFVVENEGQKLVYTSVLKLVNEVLAPPKPATSTESIDPGRLRAELAGRSPQEIVARALQLFGRDCVLAFSGAEDVAMIDMAARSGHPFSVLTLDTGRLHPDTYRFLERVRSHFGIAIDVQFPDASAVEQLTTKKGLFSFYSDGHGECCSTAHG